MSTKAEWKQLLTHHFAHALFARDDWKTAIKEGRKPMIVNGRANLRRQHIKFALMARAAARSQ